MKVKPGATTTFATRGTAADAAARGPSSPNKVLRRTKRRRKRGKKRRSPRRKSPKSRTRMGLEQ